MKKIGDITDTADGNGEFTDGNVAGNVQPTELMAAWFNSVQREVIAVLSAAGITPDKSDDAQLIAAINALLAKGIAGSGYLISKNNLSDLGDAAESRGHLGLGKLAVLDSLSASDVSAFPAEGGTVGSNGVTTPGCHVTSSTISASTQGMYLGWNEQGGQGEGDIVINPGTGGGGLVIRGVSSDNSQNLWTITIGGDGSLSTSGQLLEMGQRVYGPNNQPPIASSGVTGVKIGTRVVINNLHASGDWSGQVPAGAVLIAAVTVGDDRITDAWYAYVMYCVNGNWINTGA